MEQAKEKPTAKQERKVKGIYQRKGVYYVSFYCHDKMGFRKRFRKAIGPNKKEAEDYLGKKRAEAREGKLFDLSFRGLPAHFFRISIFFLTQTGVEIFIPADFQ